MIRQPLVHLSLLAFLVACSTDEPSPPLALDVTASEDVGPLPQDVGEAVVDDTVAPPADIPESEDLTGSDDVPRSPDVAAVEDSGIEDSGIEDSGIEDSGIEDSGIEDSGIEDGSADVPPEDTFVEPEPLDPGRVTLHRLNRSEYNRTLRDLLLLDDDFAADFPSDNHGFGFDNIADVLSTSPLLVEKWERAADTAVGRALFQPVKTTALHEFEAEDLVGTIGAASGTGWNLWSNGSVPAEVTLEGEGVWIVTVRAAETPMPGASALMSINLAGQTQLVSVAASGGAFGLYRAAFSAPPGVTTVSIGFHNDAWAPDEGFDRNLLVDQFSVEGPFEPTASVHHVELETVLGPGPVDGAFRQLAMEPLAVPVVAGADGTYILTLRADGVEGAHVGIAVDDQSMEVAPVGAASSIIEVTLQLTAGPHTIQLHEVGGDARADYLTLHGALDLAILPTPGPRSALMLCEGPESPDAVAACAQTNISAFLKRAWRRPPTEEEIAKHVALVTLNIAEGGSFEEGLHYALMAGLISPHFLFRVELDPELGTGVAHALNDWELASRLSYAIWSSMPDAELFAAADAGTLQDDDVLAEQVRRMLKDPRAAALVENFVGQWLHLRVLDDVIRDATAFPDFGPELKDAMRQETEKVMTDAMAAETDFLGVLDTDMSYVNDRLAVHYGLDTAGLTDQLTPAVMPEKRRGLLTHASLLTVTSHTFRTSPVKRGKFILGQLMCQAPSDPPPSVDTALTANEEEGPKTVRELLEIHRADPGCAGCHDFLDPFGLAFEHFDATGAWRTEDNGLPIDASGVTLQGDTFEDHLGLIPLVVANAATAECVAQHLMTYMLGRGVVTADDYDNLAQITATWTEAGRPFEDLVVGIASSEPFRLRTPPDVPPEDEEAPEEAP